MHSCVGLRKSKSIRVPLAQPPAWAARTTSTADDLSPPARLRAAGEWFQVEFRSNPCRAFGSGGSIQRLIACVVSLLGGLTSLFYAGSPGPARAIRSGSVSPMRSTSLDMAACRSARRGLSSRPSAGGAEGRGQARARRRRPALARPAGIRRRPPLRPRPSAGGRPRARQAGSACSDGSLASRRNCCDAGSRPARRFRRLRRSP